MTDTVDVSAVQREMPLPEYRAQARTWMEKAASSADPYAKKWLASH